MLPASTPRPKTDTEHRAHLIANVQAAAAGDRHPGHWESHAWYAVHSPGDFTPVEAPEYGELAELPGLGGLLGWLGSFAGPDYAQAIAQRGMEAGS
jgi:hypothetical protein